ncbi:unnamed protein product [Blepharisma stoltei]|uniref:Uncharacterized protein n=1 Tax=Blepharisma stoltei TaxID=1481888 RepID=A0AAU9KSK5_9CILI|nr:unnamed protein product [Blepharisma stoltei]
METERLNLKSFRHIATSPRFTPLQSPRLRKLVVLSPDRENPDLNSGFNSPRIVRASHVFKPSNASSLATPRRQEHQHNEVFIGKDRRLISRNLLLDKYKYAEMQN